MQNNQLLKLMAGSTAVSVFRLSVLVGSVFNSTGLLAAA
jgi:hypothetical protein